MSLAGSHVDCTLPTYMAVGKLHGVLREAHQEPRLLDQKLGVLSGRPFLPQACFFAFWNNSAYSEYWYVLLVCICVGISSTTRTPDHHAGQLRASLHSQRLSFCFSVATGPSVGMRAICGGRMRGRVGAEIRSLSQALPADLGGKAADSLAFFWV